MSSAAAPLSDGRVQNRIENYNQFWKKDLNKEEDDDNKARLDQYTEVVNGQCPACFGWILAHAHAP